MHSAKNDGGCVKAEAVLAQKFWGRHCPHLPLHHRVQFLRSPKPKKYELHIGLHLKSIISRVANSVVDWTLRL